MKNLDLEVKRRFVKDKEAYGIYAKLEEDCAKEALMQVYCKQVDSYKNYDFYHYDDEHIKSEFSVFQLLGIYEKNEYGHPECVDYIVLDEKRFSSRDFLKEAIEKEARVLKDINNSVSYMGLKDISNYEDYKDKVLKDYTNEVFERAEELCYKKIYNKLCEDIENLKQLQKKNKLEDYLENLFKEKQKTNVLLLNANSFKEFSLPYLANEEDKNSKKHKRR